MISRDVNLINHIFDQMIFAVVVYLPKYVLEYVLGSPGTIFIQTVSFILNIYCVNGKIL